MKENTDELSAEELHRAAVDTAKLTPLVSIVVSCFNIERYVEGCLDSIAQQSYPRIEVILVDDGSSDATGKLLDSFAQSRAGWKVIHKTNGGPSSARNDGFDAAKGDWLVFVDGDDLIHPDAVSTLFAAAETSGGQIICGNHYIRSNGKDVAAWPASGTTRIISQKDAFESVLYHRELDVSAWGKLYARSIFEHLRFPIGRLYEDTYIFDDLIAAVPQVTYVPVPLYYYVMRSGSIVHVSWSGKQLQFIEAVDKFTEHALRLYPELSKAACRRRVHARLSVLRYMEDVQGPEKKLRAEIVSFIRKNGRQVLTDPQAPRRDKAGILLAGISPRLYFWFWRLYSRLRPDR